MENNIQSIAIGGFDGMHLAHQKLFEQLGDNGAIVVIETGYANLTPHEYRQKYTHYPIFYFTLQDIKHLSGTEFILLLQKNFPNLEKIVVGYDFGFGANKSSNAKDLKTLFSKNVVIVDEFICDGISVHSKEIRNFLKIGKLDLANQFLGKNYQICGTKIQGQGLGTTTFVPTINLLVKDFLLPKEGVYVSWCYINTSRYKSVTFIGHRQSTDGTFAVETHLINKALELDGEKEVCLEFIAFLRDNQKFDSFESLKEAIVNDIQDTINFFERVK